MLIRNDRQKIVISAKAGIQLNKNNHISGQKKIYLEKKIMFGRMTSAIEEIVLFGRALSESEIKELMGFSYRNHWAISTWGDIKNECKSLENH